MIYGRGALQSDSLKSEAIILRSRITSSALPARLPDANSHPAGARVGRRLVSRVLARCAPAIAQASRFSSLPPEFLVALAMTESHGNPRAIRFEPAVHRRLQAFAAGQSTTPEGFVVDPATPELADRLHPKAGHYHLRYLTPEFAASHARALATLPDEALRELACSWGFTQIMGYHVLCRGGAVRDLLEPYQHFHLATQLLAEFVESYQLDPRCEFAELFRCWNTGQPYGETTDPAYVDKGLRHLAECRRWLAERALASAGTAAARATVAAFCGYREG
jgi:hypothetical protein